MTSGGIFVTHCMYYISRHCFKINITFYCSYLCTCILYLCFQLFI